MELEIVQSILIVFFVICLTISIWLLANQGQRKNK